MMRTINEHGVEIYRLENAILRVEIAPALGGKISSIYNKLLTREFLWINHKIPFSAAKSGDEYDPHFIGGMDELLPNDVPETIDGISYPDHGELWTTALDARMENETITVSGHLKKSGLYYQRALRLIKDEPRISLNYLIRNDSAATRHFLWKIHAALIISAGDKLYTPAARAQVVDSTYSRFTTELTPFDWPVIENTDASVVPLSSKEVDFFYLFDIPEGTMQLHYQDGSTVFACDYDKNIFPFQWWFASYGGFLGHYTAIIEPCTNMPIMVNDAIARNQSAVLDPGEELKTEIILYAGGKKQYGKL